MKVRPMREEERERVAAIIWRSFNMPPGIRREPTLTRAAEEYWVAEERSQIVGTLCLPRLGHFYGGRSVPSAAVTTVAVAPEARGRRVAERTLKAVLREAAPAVPISTLYPATVPLYRRCGYDYFAVRTRFRAELRKLPRGPAPKGTSVEPWTDADMPDALKCYGAFARTCNGALDRPPTWWTDRVFVPWEGREVYRYVVRENGAVTGTIVYSQDPRESAWHFDVACRDLFWTTPGAARELLALAARHRSLGADLTWYGAPNEPLTGYMEEQDAKVESTFWMMGRILDVSRAFEARGYPRHVRASVGLEIRDDLIEANNGAWHVEVEDGAAKATRAKRGSSGAPAIDIRALALLWSCMQTASEVQRSGRIAAGDATISALDSIFAGPTPWLVDMF